MLLKRQETPLRLQWGFLFFGIKREVLWGVSIKEVMSVNYNSRLTTIKIPGIKN
jgi:hypothetical protein